jgi:pimeloyl-ACP methyl ester carboxylesterase
VDTEHGGGPDALRNQLPSVPHRIIAGTSHWPQLDRPDEFNLILDEFLRGVGGSSKS